MKLKEGTKVRIINYGHIVRSHKKLFGGAPSGEIKDLMPQYVGKEGVIKEVGPGYMIQFKGDDLTTGWFEEDQVEEL